MPCAFVTEPVRTLDTRTPVSVPAAGLRPRATWRLGVLCQDPAPRAFPPLVESAPFRCSEAGSVRGVGPSCESWSPGTVLGTLMGGEEGVATTSGGGREEPRRAHLECGI